MASIESGIVILNAGTYPGWTLRVAIAPAISYRITGGEYHDVTPVGDRWRHRRWTIHLYNPVTGKRMQFGYMTGLAIDKPEIMDALDSIFSDAQSVEWEAFGPVWAEDYGYDAGDPEPWVTYHTATGQTGMSGKPKYDPRPEYDAVQHNEPNPILVKFRSRDYPASYWAHRLGKGDLPVGVEATEGHVHHARKVLSRLAALTENG